MSHILTGLLLCVYWLCHASSSDAAAALSTRAMLSLSPAHEADATDATALESQGLMQQDKKSRCLFH